MKLDPLARAAEAGEPGRFNVGVSKTLGPAIYPNIAKVLIVGVPKGTPALWASQIRAILANGVPLPAC